MGWWIFGKKKAPPPSLGDGTKEMFIGLQFETDGFIEIVLVNQALNAFEGREALPWHLTMIIEMEDVVAELGLPTKEEQQVLGKLGEELGAGLKANGNAMFVASGSWRGIREIHYRVRDPEAANTFLTEFVANPAVPRAMEYRMGEDVGWASAEKYLEAARRGSRM